MNLDAPAGDQYASGTAPPSGDAAYPAADPARGDASPAGEPSIRPEPGGESAPADARAGRIARFGGILVAVAISAGIFAFRDQLIGLAAYGYVGLFFLALFGSATIIFPMPGLVLAFAAGGTLSPFLAGLAFGSGAAIGELTGYLAGFGGSGVIESRAGYQQMRDWMKRWGVGVIFALSVVPNPAFDIAGITAGALRIPVWQFMLAAWAGNVVKATLVALAGAGAMGVVGPLVQNWLAR